MKAVGERPRGRVATRARCPPVTSTADEPWTSWLLHADDDALAITPRASAPALWQRRRHVSKVAASRTFGTYVSVVHHVRFQNSQCGAVQIIMSSTSRRAVPSDVHIGDRLSPEFAETTQSTLLKFRIKDRH